MQSRARSLWLAFFAVLVVIRSTPSQSAVRCWGRFQSTTEGREGVFVKVSAGWYTTSVVRADGRAFINGENTYGNCLPPALSPGLFWADAQSRTYGLGLVSDGTVRIWGQSVGTPPSIPQLPPGTHYVQIGAGDGHGIALRSDGVIVMLGDPALCFYGQLLVPPIPPGLTVRSVSAGSGHSLALLSDGTILAWGYNFGGECNVPALPNGVTYIDMYAGEHHSVAIRSDGSVVAWGDNIYGQCNVPALPFGVRYLLAAAGGTHSQAYRSDGVFVAWGDNSLGQLDVPSLPQGIKCRQLACGQHHSVALLSNGRVTAWGNNDWQNAYVASLAESAIVGTDCYLDAAAGEYHVLAVLSNGALQAWGNNLAGQSTIPVSLQRCIKVAAGSVHNVALTRSGDLVAWGDPTFGRTTVPTLPPGIVYVDVDATKGHNVALRSDGSAVAWGYNANGECNIPALPAGLRYVDVDAVYYNTLLVRSDGQIVHAGRGFFPPAIAPSLPVGVGYYRAAATIWFGVGIRTDGQAEWWGSTANVDPNWHSLPALPQGVSYIDVAGGGDYTSLLRSDGQIVVCGLTPYNEEKVPSLDPGTSYLSVSSHTQASVAMVGPSSTYTTFATGCAGSMGPARLVPHDQPRIGRPFNLMLFDLPVDVAALTMGWQAITPVTLSALGMPGCALYVDPAAVGLLVGQQHHASWSMTIPYHPALIGVHFYNQALVLDPNSGNQLGAVMSDAAEGVVGR